MATLPNPNPVNNSALANYQYSVDPTTTPVSTSNLSNNVQTQINVADTLLTKSVNYTVAAVGQVLLYTVVLNNAGNVTAQNVVLTDTIPNDTSFIGGTVTVNGVTLPSEDPTPGTGVSVGEIAPNGVSTVTFQVTVNTIPNPNPIPNSAVSSYDYDIDPSTPGGGSGNRLSNTVNTQVNFANLSNVTKQVDKTNAKVGDTLLYTIVIPNTGNVTPQNVFIVDTIPIGVSFITNSVTIAAGSTTQNAGAVSPNPPGFAFNLQIGPGQTGTVTFSVLVNTLPTINPVPNSGIVASDTNVSQATPFRSQNGTNTVNTLISTVGLSSQKAVSDNYAQVGQTITYYVGLTNTSTSTAQSIRFIDTIPNGTTFVPDSVYIDNVQQPGASPVPPTGVAVQDLAPNATTTVSFSVTVNTIPTVNPIPNTGTATFTQTVDPAQPAIPGSTVTNQVTTQVNQAAIDNSNGGGLTKGVNTNYAKVGDTLIYTIGIKNTGNVAATNVVFSDTIPNDTTFELDSVKLNGVTQPGATVDPGVGFFVGTIPAGGVATVTFNVRVDTIPNPNPIPNSGTVNYNFTIIPTVPNGGSGGGNTNTVNTQVNQATIDNGNGGGLQKSTDRAFGKTGDIITYTIGLKNTGNVTASNVVLIDTIPNGTTFVPNSITQDLAPKSGTVAPPTGFAVGNILPGAATTIIFKVTIVSIPTPNPIPNQGSVTYNFTQIPTVPNGASGAGITNVVNTQVNQAIIDNTTTSAGLVKGLTPSFVALNDTIKYTITLKNLGNVNADNVILTDTIPEGTSFVPDSVTLDFAPQPGAVVAPPTGFNVGTITPGQVRTVTFNVTVNTIPTPNPIPNSATTNFSYTEDPAQPQVDASGNSNTVYAVVNSGSLVNGGGGITKYVDKTQAIGGEQLLYTIVIKNTGNVTDNNVFLVDTIPTSTTFVVNSVRLNGAPQPGAVVAPPSGFSIGSLYPAQAATVTFNVTVITTPTINPIPNQAIARYSYTVFPTIPNGVTEQTASNIVNTTVNQAQIDNSTGGLTKSVDVQFAQVGQIINYTIDLNNTGNTTANNTVFIDTIPNGTTFVTDSVYLNGVQQLGANPAPPTGVPVGDIYPQVPQRITFQVRVNTIPTPNPIPNRGSVGFSYVANNQTGQINNATGATNIVNTQVNQAFIDAASGGGLTKQVSQTFAKVGDILTYTIPMKNTGNVAATNVVLIDTTPNGTAFIVNSLTFNGATQIGADPNPPTGFTVGTIAANQTVTVAYRVQVTTLPTINPIPNSANLTFNFAVIPTIPNSGAGSGNSNFVNTQVNQATIDNNNGGGLQKSVDKAYASEGDILSYTITLSNTGNVTANNVVFTDTIPGGTSFVANSVYVDGTQRLGQSVAPPTGVTVAQIAPGATSQIVFQVLVTTIPTINPIPNTGTVNYQFTSNPANPNGSTGSGNTNTVFTQVNQAEIDNSNGGGLVKSRDLAFADINDVITYTVTFKNTGNVTAVNVQFTDTIPNDTALVTDSVVVNGAVQPGQSPAPPTGVLVGNIFPGYTSTVSFKVTVLTVPSPNPIPNSGTVNFNYTKDPANLNAASGAGNSNTVTTQVNTAVFPSGVNGINKQVNRAFAKVNDVVTYTVTFKNSGTVTASNVVFIDTIPGGTTFVTNSVTVNGAGQAGANPAPPSGVNIGTIFPGRTTTVTFSVLVNTLPTINPIPNQALMNYQYQTNPGLVPKNASSASQVVETQVNQATIDNNNGGGLVKSGSPSFAKVNDVITYTITFNNTGNVTANNVVFTDTIPKGTNFVADSVYVDGTQQLGANPAPPSGVNIGSLYPQTPRVLSFQVTVVSIPTPNPIPNTGTVNYNFTADPAAPNAATGSGNTNTVNTQVNQAIIDNNTSSSSFVKYTNKGPVGVGEVIQYTIVTKNTGNVQATNVVVTDTIPNGTSFIPNTVILNGIGQPGANPATGISVGNLAPNAAATILFNVQVGNTIPTPNPIPNTALSSYSYITDPNSQTPTNANGASNTVFNQMNSAIIDFTNGGGLQKSVDKGYASPNEILTYTISINNTGNVTANSVVFKDTIPTGTKYVNNSVTINGVSQPGVNPQNGVTVGNIAPGATQVVRFSVQVGPTIPSPNPVVNNSTVNYNYIVDPSNPLPRNAGGNSNQALTQINSPGLDNINGGLTKYRSVAFADVGDTIDYTIVLKNTGNVDATNVVVTDTTPNGTSLVANSLRFNGIPQGNANLEPPTGFNIGTLVVNAVATLVYSVTVNTIPTPNPIPNSANATFKYTVYPTIPDGASGSGNSNIVTTQVNSGGLDPAKGGFTKTSSPSNVAVGDTITYTLSLKNTGNTTLTNVIVKDTIPNGTTFVTNSVRLNGTTQPGVNPQLGVTVGTMAPGNAQTIVFSVIANTIPSPNPIPNTATATYQYVVDPAAPPRNGGNNSTETLTQVNQATIDNRNGGGFVKSTSPDYVKVGDIITYTLSLTNTGNVAANNVIVRDTIPNGTTFVQNSVNVNGSTVPGNIATGVNVGTVNALNTTTVTFNVLVNTIPTPNPIPNSATLSYNFIIDPSNPVPRNGFGNSNTVFNPVNTAIIDNKVGGGFTKSVNSNYADINDTLTYTIGVKNTGNITAINVVITDTIPNGTTFVDNSVRLNGVQQPGVNPQSPGVTVGDLGPGASATIIFNVVVNTLPVPNPIPNSATSSFSYVVNPQTGETAQGSGNTNIVNTQVNNGGFDPNKGGMTKYADKNYYKIGDTIVYKVVLKNTGNVSVNNVVFTDTIPSGTSFQTNSFRVNNVQQPGVSPAPPSGASLGTINAGQTVTVEFSVTVITLPNPNPIPNQAKIAYNYTVIPTVPNGKSGQNISNQTFSQVNDPNISPTNGGAVKYTSKNFATIGDFITYTVVIKNNGNVPASNLTLFDTIPRGTNFVTDTVRLNGVPQPGINPQSGVSIAQLTPGQVLTMTFDVQVFTLPLVNPIPNTADVSFRYTVDPSVPDGAQTRFTTNSVTTQINAAQIDNTPGSGQVKTVDKAYADINDTLTYIINLRNTGNVTATNVVFFDTIPQGTQLVTNSVLVNGAVQSGLNPQGGVNIPNLSPNGVASVQFKVTVITLPSPNPIPNSSTTTFGFVVNPQTGQTKNSSGNSNIVNTQVNNASMNNGSGGFTKSVDKAVTKVGDILTYTLTLTNTGNVAANNAVIIDTVPNGTQYVLGTASVNGNPVSITSPTNGIPVGTVNPGQTSTIQFQVLVVQVPAPNPIPNTGSVKFTYTVDPAAPNGKNGGGNSNTVLTGLNQAIIDNASGGATKYRDLAFADIGQQINYTIALKNTGTSGATNVVFTDTIPEGTNLVPNSVFLNGVPQGSGNPQTGINVGSLNPNQLATITFAVTVITIPNTNPIPNSGTINFNYTLDPANPNGAAGSGNTNVVNTQVNHGSIVPGDGGFMKYADKVCAGLGEEINYTVVVKNTGNVAVNNLVVIDTIPNETALVPNSVRVNGSVYSGVDPRNGVTLGTVAPSAVQTITFSATVFTLPLSGQVSNVAYANYSYTVNPSNPNGVKASSVTSPVTTNVYSARITGNNFTKAVDKAYADLGDILTYTIRLTNNGNTPANNVEVFDTLPVGTSLVANSVKINGGTQSGIDPQTGIPIGTIAVGATVVVTYQVKVQTIGIPSPNPIPNNADVEYEYNCCGQVAIQARGSSIPV